jgi:type IX secretion system PorP/SprF family membrane protein
MKNRGILVVLFFLVTLALPTQAQDAHFSQMYSAPSYLNPALVGSTLEGKFSLTYRAQWTKMAGDFTTYQASYEYSTPKKPSSFGVMFLSDKVGTVGAKSSFVQISYAHTVRLGKTMGLRAGGQVGYGNRTLDYNQLVFGDQLNELGYVGSPSLEQGFPNLSINYLDASAGLVLYGENFWLGVSGLYLNQPRYNWGGSIERVPMRYSLQTGIRIVKEPANKDKRSSYVWAFIPALHYSRQGNFQQLDVGFHYHISPLIVGLWYRGMPIVQNHYGALVATAGFNYRQMMLLYSYDVGVSRFAQSTGGAHEFSMAIRFGTYEARRKVKRKSKELLFPQFLY